MVPGAATSSLRAFLDDSRNCTDGEIKRFFVSHMSKSGGAGVLPRAAAAVCDGC
jgi:hypothetical protein